MSGSFKHHVCHRCQGDGHIRTCGELWDDIKVCPTCEGGGTLYEYIPNDEGVDSPESDWPSEAEIEECWTLTDPSYLEMLEPYGFPWDDKSEYIPDCDY